MKTEAKPRWQEYSGSAPWSRVIFSSCGPLWSHPGPGKIKRKPYLKRKWGKNTRSPSSGYKLVSQLQRGESQPKRLQTWWLCMEPQTTCQKAIRAWQGKEQSQSRNRAMERNNCRPLARNANCFDCQCQSRRKESAHRSQGPKLVAKHMQEEPTNHWSHQNTRVNTWVPCNKTHCSWMACWAISYIN